MVTVYRYWVSPSLSPPPINPHPHTPPPFSPSLMCLMVSVDVIKRHVYLVPFVFPVFADGADSSSSATDEEEEKEEKEEEKEEEEEERGGAEGRDEDAVTIPIPGLAPQLPQ